MPGVSHSPFKVGVRECALADLDPRLEAFVAAGNFSPDLGARYLEFENLRQDTAYDFLLRPPTTASSGRFLCHEVPLSANIARLMPPWRPVFSTVFSVRLAPVSASSEKSRLTSEVAGQSAGEIIPLP